MTSIREVIRRFFTPNEPIPSGTYQYQAPPESQQPYRLHLRIEPDGHGVLIVNASIVLHLNNTATEYAYHLIKKTDTDQAAREIASRYRIKPTEAQKDFDEFVERIQELIHTPDLDPIAYLDFDRHTPYSQDISAPYRLDCAITYTLPASTNPDFAPVKRVDRELETDEWKLILDKAWDAGVPHVIFTGGEPTLRDDLPELIRHAESIGQVSGLLTDGIQFSDSPYLDEILQTGLDHIMVVFQPGNMQNETALRNLISADIALIVHLTITPENASRASSWVDRFAEMGIEKISLSTTNPEMRNTISQIHNQAIDLGLSLIWDLPVPYSSNNPISLEVVEEQLTEGAGKGWLYVEPDGDVLPAQGINQVLGNIIRDPWELIWDRAKAAWSKPS